MDTRFTSPTPGVLMDKRFKDHRVAVDLITLAINECMTISSAMRKVSRWSQTGVAAILGGSDFFGEDELLSNTLGFTNSNTASTANSTTSSPLLSSFLQLRSILMDSKDIYTIDGLTILQPFLLVIKSSSTSGYITSLALDSISKFLNYDIICSKSKNLQTSLIQIISSLTHCRFEAADQNSDDAVLLKVLRLMEWVLTSPMSNLLPNEVVSEVIQTCLSLACNKRRSEVLRKSAEMTIQLITIRIFQQLQLIPQESNGDDFQTDFSANQLPADTIGSTSGNVSVVDLQESLTVTSTEEPLDPEIVEKVELSHEDPFGIVCLNEFMGILISMISPTNQYQHMESTRVLALNLINTAIEVSGDDIPLHPSLMMLIADPVAKHVLLIITIDDSPALLQAALKLFDTMAIVLGDHLKSQIELTFTLLFNSILPPPAGEKNDALKGNKATINTRLTTSKEMLIESLSLLWIRDPYFFVKLLIDYDCDFDRSDLSKKIIEFLCKLTLPESASISTDNVPPICLEGLLSFISGINERVEQNGSGELNFTSLPQLIINKNNKAEFIKCTEQFNKKPSEGLRALGEAGFISNIEDTKAVAEFMYNKSVRLNKKVLGEFLAKPSNKELLKYFIDLFDFTGLRVDEALRVLLKAFRLPGESQQIERIVELFGDRYAKCQELYHPENEVPGEEFVRPDSDSVFVLSYSIILLNTDLHNPQVKKQMTLDAYTRNVKGTYNNGDYPSWYLSKIYSSIKDKEIIMPEEHHGTDKWFDDAWHNLISSSSFASNTSSFNEAVNQDICVYDKYLFEENIDILIDTLIQVFKEATDDHVITRLMSSIDKCVNICLFYHVDLSIAKLIGLLADLTMLTTKQYRIKSEDGVRESIPVTQIKIDKKEDAITVSDMSVWFGRDFKAQISTVVLFRLIKKTDCKITDSWDKVLRIILTLFENSLLNPNLFSDFQTKLKLPPLPKVKPRYIINRAKPLKDAGLLSTFSSFLRYSDEPPEPSDQEVESSLSSIDCVKSLNIFGIFRIIGQGNNHDKGLLIKLLLGLMPEYSPDNKRYYESEILFMFEIVVCLALLVNDEELTRDSFECMHKLSISNDISKNGHIRLITYKLLLVRTVSVDVTVLEECLTSILEFDKDFLVKNNYLLQPLISLLDDESWCCKSMLVSESYWKLLRLLGSIVDNSTSILDFADNLIHQSPQDISPNNFLLVLGLLDETSSLGAMAAQSEQEPELHRKPDQIKYLQDIVVSSKKSIGLTAEMASLLDKDEFDNENSGYPLIQALSHQCFNPCREIRSYGLNVLKSTVLAVANKNLKPFEIFEYGLFPLLRELAKPSVLQTDPSGFNNTRMEALSVISKIFLQFTNTFENDQLALIWFGVLDSFKMFNDLKEKDNLIKESGVELLKNMLLVLETSNILQQGNELWDSTWNRVYSIYPDLKRDLVAGEPRNKNKNEGEGDVVAEEAVHS